MDKTALDEAMAKATPRSLNSAMFNMAKAYSETGDLADREAARSGNADFIAPEILCKAFAVEMLLKFFIVIQYPDAKTKADLDKLGVNLEGHHYSTLFDRIEESRRKKIAASFSSVSGEPTTDVAFRRILKRRLGDEPFVFWRYIYEKAGNNYFDLHLLRTILQALGEAAAQERAAIEAAKHVAGGPKTTV